VRVSLWTTWLCLCLGCGPAVSIDGEIVSSDPATTEGPEVPIEMEESKPTCITPVLSSLRAELFVPTCGSCHSGTAPAEGLDLTLEETALRDRLMQSASQSPSGLRLIMPGSTGSSYLFLKIAVKTPLIGERMPKDQDPLAKCTVEGVRKWILDGAN
jgi:hypothetical protein